MACALRILLRVPRCRGLQPKPNVPQAGSIGAQALPDLQEDLLGVRVLRVPRQHRPHAPREHSGAHTRKLA